MLPDIKVEIYATIDSITSWVDISNDVVGFSINRGRSRDLDSFQAGNCSIQFYNKDDKYTPENSSSPLFGNIIPMKQFRIKGIVSGIEYNLFRGFAQDFKIEFTDAGIASFATIQCVDAFGILANQEMLEVSPSYANDYSGQRITRVLNLPEINFPSDLRDIDTGTSTFGNTTFGQNALQYLQQCEKSEVGSLFTGKDGRLTFYQRGANTGETLAIFSDKQDILDRSNYFVLNVSTLNGSNILAPDSIHYSKINLEYNTTLLYNRIIVEGTTGNQFVAQDTTSQQMFQIRSLNRTGLFNNNDTDLQNQSKFLLGKFKEPEFRITNIEVKMGAIENQLQPIMLNLELANRVEIHKTTPSGDELVQFAVIDSLNWRYVVGTSFDCTIGVSSGAGTFAFTLNDSIIGRLDTNILGY